MKLCLAFVLALSLCNIQIIEANNGINEFVRRLYKECLNHNADANGLQYWVNRIEKKEISVNEMVQGFFFSNEMNKANLNVWQWTDRCYKTLLNRKADAKGKEYWVNILIHKMSRREMLDQFMQANEFKKLCESYGLKVEQNTKPQTQNTTTGDALKDYVVRLYRNVLGREADSAGLEHWFTLLMEKRTTPYLVATESFFHSAEFNQRSLSSQALVNILYATFLNRTPDVQGNAYWLSRINRKESRDAIIHDFATSVEFKSLMEKTGWKARSNAYIAARLNNVNDILIVANKKHKLPDYYEPTGLVAPNVNHRNGTQFMRPEAARALERMFAAARQAGMYLIAGSGYRSYATQVSTYNYWASLYGYAGADRVSARAGYSEHQTGLAMDIGRDDGYAYLDTAVEYTAEAQWLKENAYRFGFILRYPKGKEHITGYSFESWHFRYIGEDYAKALVSEGGLEYTMEEYFGFEGGVNY